MLTKNLAIVSTTTKAHPADVALCASAIQKQVTRDVSPIWDISATVDYFPDLKSVPAGYWPIIISDNINQPGAAGFHTDNHHQPYSLVQFDDTWQLTCSHEALEMLIDPYGNRMIASDSIDPNNPGRVNYLVEVCDPCEDTSFAYSVNGVLLSDFYTPNFFDPVVNSGVRYSFTGAIKAPKQVLVNGYLSWVEPISGQWYQATYFGAQLAINPLNGMQSKGDSLRSQVDRLTHNPNKLNVFKQAVEKHNAVTDNARAVSGAIAKSRLEEIASRGYFEH